MQSAATAAALSYYEFHWDDLCFDFFSFVLFNFVFVAVVVVVAVFRFDRFVPVVLCRVLNILNNIKCVLCQCVRRVCVIFENQNLILVERNVMDGDCVSKTRIEKKKTQKITV